MVVKKLYSLDIRGREKEWSFEIIVDPKYIEEWRIDGIKINEIVNKIPQWWVDMWFSVKFWCFWQDLFNFNNLFAK